MWGFQKSSLCQHFSNSHTLELTAGDSVCLTRTVCFNSGKQRFSIITYLLEGAHRFRQLGGVISDGCEGMGVCV